MLHLSQAYRLLSVEEAYGYGQPGLTADCFAGLAVSPMMEAEAILSVNKPDICLIQTVADLASITPTLQFCAKLGINVLTIAESVYYPW